MHCTSCGAQLEPNDRFCGACGTEVPLAQGAQPTSEAPPPRGSSRALIIGLGLVAVAAVAAAGWLLTRDPSGEPSDDIGAASPTTSVLKSTTTQSPEPSVAPPPPVGTLTFARNVAGLQLNSPMALSPTGQHLIAFRDPGELCVFDLESSEDICPGWDGSVGSISWSPDGSTVAFTEDFFTFLEESDIWVIKIDTGELTNLTDDGESGTSSATPDGTPFDYWPVWSSDSSRIHFARSERRGGELTNMLMETNSTTGAVRQIAALESAASSVTAMPETQSLAVWTDPSETTFLVIDTDSGVERTFETGERGLRVLASLGESHILLGSQLRFVGSNSGSGEPLMKILDIDSGSVRVCCEIANNGRGPLQVFLDPTTSQIAFWWDSLDAGSRNISLVAFSDLISRSAQLSQAETVYSYNPHPAGFSDFVGDQPVSVVGFDWFTGVQIAATNGAVLVADGFAGSEDLYWLQLSPQP